VSSDQDQSTFSSRTHYKKKSFFPRIITYGFFSVCKLFLSTKNSVGNIITQGKEGNKKKIHYLRILVGGKT